MGWLVWFICSVAFLAIGGALMRNGRTGIVKAYIGACLLCFLLTLFKFGHLFGESFAPVPWIICTALIPAIFILSFIAVRRDREAVLGPTASRDATASAAIIYGAGAMHDTGGADASGGGEM